MVLVPPAILLNVWPPSVLICHCTVGAGKPLAAAVKVAICPALTVWFLAFAVMVGAWLTVRVKLWVALLPTLLEAAKVSL